MVTKRKIGQESQNKQVGKLTNTGPLLYCCIVFIFVQVIQGLSMSEVSVFTLPPKLGQVHLCQHCGLIYQGQKLWWFTPPWEIHSVFVQDVLVWLSFVCLHFVGMGVLLTHFGQDKRCWQHGFLLIASFSQTGLLPFWCFYSPPPTCLHISIPASVQTSHSRSSRLQRIRWWLCRNFAINQAALVLILFQCSLPNLSG